MIMYPTKEQILIRMKTIEKTKQALLKESDIIDQKIKKLNEEYDILNKLFNFVGEVKK